MRERSGYSLIRFVLTSAKRTGTLLMLRGGSRTLREIREATGSSSSGIIPQLRLMEEKGLILRRSSEYELTDTGRLIAEHLHRSLRMADLIVSDADFWNSHDISAIPEDFRMRLYDIGNYRVITAAGSDVLMIHREYIDKIKNSGWILDVCPVFHPEYLRDIVKLADDDRYISLIITESVLSRVVEHGEDTLAEALEHPGVDMRICRNAGVGLTVTESMFAMMLPLKTGLPDFYTRIISLECSAVRFGMELYLHHEANSYPLKHPHGRRTCLPEALTCSAPQHPG